MTRTLSWHRFRQQVRRLMLERPIATFAASVPVLILIDILLVQLLPAAVDRSFIHSLVGGLVASLAAYSLIQYFYLQQSHYELRRWLQVGHKPIRIVPTMITHPSEPRYAPRNYFVIPPFDAQAAGLLTEIFRTANYRYPQRRSVGSHHLDENILPNNLVLMCLPSRNIYTRLFLGLYYEWIEDRGDRLKIISKDNWERYTADDHCALNYFGLRMNENTSQWQMLDWSEDQSNKWKTSSINHRGINNVHKPGGDPDTDYALVLRAPNPFNPETSVLIVSGIHGIGTYGAALWLYKNSTTLLRRYGDEPQTHLLRVDYRMPPGRSNYVDAVVAPPTEVVATKNLSLLLATPSGRDPE